MPWLITFDLWTWQTFPKSNYIIYITLSVPGSGMHKIRPEFLFLVVLLYWYHLKVIWVYKTTNGQTYGWTDVCLGGLMDRQTTWEHIITGTLRWPGNNIFNVPISTFFIQFSDKPAAILKMAAILKTTTWRTWSLGALNQKLLGILCSIIWP